MSCVFLCAFHVVLRPIYRYECYPFLIAIGPGRFVSFRFASFSPVCLSKSSWTLSRKQDAGMCTCTCTCTVYRARGDRLPAGWCVPSSIIIITKSAFASDNVSQTITNPFVPSTVETPGPVPRTPRGRRSLHSHDSRLLRCLSPQLRVVSPGSRLGIRPVCLSSAQVLCVCNSALVPALVLPALAHSRAVVAVPGCPFVPVRPHPVSACKLGN